MSSCFEDTLVTALAVNYFYNDSVFYSIKSDLKQNDSLDWENGF